MGAKSQRTKGQLNPKDGGEIWACNVGWKVLSMTGIDGTTLFQSGLPKWCPSYTHWAIRGGPTALGSKVNPPFKVREQDHGDPTIPSDHPIIHSKCPKAIKHKHLIAKRSKYLFSASPPSSMCSCWMGEKQMADESGGDK